MSTAVLMDVPMTGSGNASAGEVPAAIKKRINAAASKMPPPTRMNNLIPFMAYSSKMKRSIASMRSRFAASPTYRIVSPADTT